MNLKSLKVRAIFLILVLFTNPLFAQPSMYVGFDVGQFLVNDFSHFEKPLFSGVAVDFEVTSWLSIATNARIHGVEYSKTDYDNSSRFDASHTIYTLSVAPSLFWEMGDDIGIYFSPSVGKAFQRTKSSWQKLESKSIWNENSNRPSSTIDDFIRPEEPYQQGNWNSFFYHSIGIGLKGFINEKRLFASLGLQLESIDVSGTMQRVRFDNGRVFEYDKGQTYFLGYHIKVGWRIFGK